MKLELFDFQKDALAQLREHLAYARANAQRAKNPRALTFSAPTGSGKTIVMTALFEEILRGAENFEGQPDAVILWISDSPELNNQTRLKIEGKASRIGVSCLHTIGPEFDEQRLQGGRIYFMNTQKLGSEARLTRTGDERKHTIWQILANTIKAARGKFYVVIDEAHRGMARGKSEKVAHSILQKFIKGSPDDGLPPMPLVIGISATPLRFDELLAGTQHSQDRVAIAPEAVRESGLIKDQILLTRAESAKQAEMTLVHQAASCWKTVTERWKKYCKKQEEHLVAPILVIQVQDGSGKKLTKTDISTCLQTVEKAIGRKLKSGEVAHTFHGQNGMTIGGRKIRYIEASRIEDEQSVGVVLFKMNLSTGWDCPRAEVMMSFRSGKDHTHVAQLLGRMVRSPLARRIDADPELNNVHLFLPHYDEDALQAVIHDLKSSEDIPPSVVVDSKKLVKLYRRKRMQPVFKSLGERVTYRVNAVRRQSNLRRLTELGRRLTYDRIDESAHAWVRKKILKKIGVEVRRIRGAETFERKVKEVLDVAVTTLAYDYRDEGTEERGGQELEANLADVERRFAGAGRVLGNGLHLDYWKENDKRAAVDVKAELIVLTRDEDGMSNLETFADATFNELFAKNRPSIQKLKEKSSQHYDRLYLSAGEPKPVEWSLPDEMDVLCSEKAPPYGKHLFVEESGGFRADLKGWEDGVICEEIEDAKVSGWLRNTPFKTWSLEIPYEDGGETKPMFPDFVVVRKSAEGYELDILEPHQPTLGDNVAKAQGLAKFAEKHWKDFSRIELIRKMRGPVNAEKYFRLDLGDAVVRKAVSQITAPHQLNELFVKYAKPGRG